MTVNFLFGAGKYGRAGSRQSSSSPVQVANIVLRLDALESLPANLDLRVWAAMAFLFPGSRYNSYSGSGSYNIRLHPYVKTSPQMCCLRSLSESQMRSIM